MEKDKKQAIILSLVAVITLIVVVIGATYAYFKAQNGSSSQSDINVTTYTTDVLTFSVGEAINMNITQSDFKKDMGNKSASTYAKAMLTANNKTNEATVYYNIYLDIVTNNFVHSQSDETGELILKITDPQGNELKSIDGLNYKEVTDGKGNKISGFDITTQTELVTIASNYAITATPKKEDTWNVTLTFVNLDKDQSKNAGKSFGALLKIQKNEENAVAENICKNGTNLAECIKSQFTGVQGENNLYHHDGTLENGINDDSYRYAGASENVCLSKSGEIIKSKFTDNACQKIYKIGEYMRYDNTYVTDSKSVVWDGKTCKTVDGDDVTNAIGNYHPEPVDSNNCTGNAYYLKDIGYDEGYYVEAYTGVVELQDEGTIYDAVNNYVCFSDNDSSCSDDDLYRIMGVFNGRVKLVKYKAAKQTLLEENGTDEFGWYTWSNNSTSHNWSDSELNTVNLNTNYLNNIGTYLSDKIDITSWVVRGLSNDEYTSENPANIYQNEILNATSSDYYNAKVGLAYVSDYVYSVLPKFWNFKYDYSRDFSSPEYATNWMDDDPDSTSDSRQWTITFVRHDDGDYHYNDAWLNSFGNYYIAERFGAIVKPVFYLKNNVTYKSGNGAISNPIKLS